MTVIREGSIEIFRGYLGECFVFLLKIFLVVRFHRVFAVNIKTVVRSFLVTLEVNLGAPNECVCGGLNLEIQI